jgi:hypothetical protein
LSQPSWHVRITGEVFKYTDARLLPWGFWIPYLGRHLNVGIFIF